jgi:hypothetical protein
LAPDQKERLRAWWKPANGDWAYSQDEGEISFGEYYISDLEKSTWAYDGGCGCCSSSCNVADFLPLLTIGQCIELLKGSKQYGFAEIGDLFYGVSQGYVEQEELIDALWEAVKAVL